MIVVLGWDFANLQNRSFIFRDRHSSPMIRKFPFFGAGGGTWTRDPRITSAVLYQLSYTGPMMVGF